MSLDPEIARQNMIQQQIRCWDVAQGDVLDTLRSVPREHFVAPEYSSLAFADTRLPLEADSDDAQTLMTPALEGRVLQALELSPDDRVLEIGTGSGYLTACLARLAGFVTSIEISAPRAERASARLAELGITNCDIQVQDVFARDATETFDAIAVTGSLPTYDPRFEAWLNPGGRAFLMVGTGAMQEALRVRRTNGGVVRRESLFETFIAPLVNTTRPPSGEFRL